MTDYDAWKLDTPTQYEAPEVEPAAKTASFPAGTLVRCTNASFSAGLLEHGAIYAVTAFYAAPNQITLAETADVPWTAHRFTAADIRDHGRVRQPHGALGFDDAAPASCGQAWERFRTEQDLQMSGDGYTVDDMQQAHAAGWDAAIASGRLP